MSIIIYSHLSTRENVIFDLERKLQKLYFQRHNNNRSNTYRYSCALEYLSLMTSRTCLQYKRTYKSQAKKWSLLFHHRNSNTKITKIQFYQMNCSYDEFSAPRLWQMCMSVCARLDILLFFSTNFQLILFSNFIFIVFYLF